VCLVSVRGYLVAQSVHLLGGANCDPNRTFSWVEVCVVRGFRATEGCEGNSDPRAYQDETKDSFQVLDKSPRPTLNESYRTYCVIAKERELMWKSGPHGPVMRTLRVSWPAAHPGPHTRREGLFGPERLLSRTWAVLM